jgi:hypothetical protein
MSIDIVVRDTSPSRERQMYRLSLDIHLFTKIILPSDKYPDERCAPEKLKLNLHHDNLTSYSFT